MQYRPEIQLEMFPRAPMEAACEEGQFALMRPHRWANKVTGELALVEIRLKPHESQWMWAISFCSRNGSGQCYAPLPKWGKFADSRAEAMEHAVEEVRAAMNRATPDERLRIVQWCGELLAGQHS